jgi:hypothetical protein
MWRSSERSRSGWDGEFESPLLQQAVCLSGEPVTLCHAGGLTSTWQLPHLIDRDGVSPNLWMLRVSRMPQMPTKHLCS